MSKDAIVCTGTSQVLRLPNDLINNASTIGAHRSLSENGQEQRAKIACALYVLLEMEDDDIEDSTAD